MTGSGAVREIWHDRVRVLVLDNPPGNILTVSLRAALLAAITSPGAAQAIVIRGEGRGFCAGHGVEEDAAAPTLAELCRAIDTCAVPVVVALHGAVIGPGAELALAAHGRVASEDARFALPDVALGLVPEAGSTQRLPRLVGASEALRMLITGRALTATEALVIGLCDHVVAGDPLAEALALARRVPPLGPVPDRADGLRDVAAFQRAVAQGRAEAARLGLPAPEALVDLVEAALLLPFEQGLTVEAARRADLAVTPEAAGLRAAALAERRAAALPPAFAAAQVPLVNHIGIWGSGPGLVVMALVALSRGLRVTWAEPDRGRLAAALQSVATRQQAEVDSGRLTATARDADWSRLEPGNEASALAGCGMILLAAPGAGDALPHLSRLAPGVPVLVVGGGVAGAMGLSLPPAARLSELSLPEGVAPAAACVAVQVLRRVGLPPVLVTGTPGVGLSALAAGRAALLALRRMGVPLDAIAGAMAAFGMPFPETAQRALLAGEGDATPRGVPRAEILARWLAAMANEGLGLLASGALRRPSDLDHVLVAGHGFPRHQGGPMHQADLRGLMVLRADLRRWQTDDPVWTPAPLIDRLIGEGLRLPSLNGGR